VPLRRFGEQAFLRRFAQESQLHRRKELSDVSALSLLGDLCGRGSVRSRSDVGFASEEALADEACADTRRAGAGCAGLHGDRRDQGGGGYSVLGGAGNDYHGDGRADAVCVAARGSSVSGVGRAAASIVGDSFIDFSFNISIWFENLTCNFVHRKQDYQYETVSKTATAQNFPQFRKHICRVVFSGVGSGLSETQREMGEQELRKLET
jgi:hypothetical protein